MALLRLSRWQPRDLIQQKFGANAPDVAAPGKENSHGRGKCAGLALNQSEVWAGEDSATFCPSFSEWLRPSAARNGVCSEGQALSNFVRRAPLQNINVHVADAPAVHIEPARLVKVNRVRADQRSPVIVDHIFFAWYRQVGTAFRGDSATNQRRTQHVPAGEILTERVVMAASPSSWV